MNFSDWLTTFAADILGLVVSAVLLAIYHLYLRMRVKRNPAYTVQAVNVMARTSWVQYIMKEEQGILAVQTLRNSTMAATFLASTAVLLIIGVLTLSEQGDKLGSAFHSLNFVGARRAELWMGKLLLLMLDLFVAFFSFSMSIRIYNHVGFMINVPKSAGHRAISPDHVAVHLNRAGHFYSIGMRAYYFLVPLVFWLFGPHLMLLATIALIFVLYRIDRAPKILEQDYSR
jgi:uncharacterized membrane protein